ncbi:copper chaperone PCu(A)C [Alishewanella sp. 16-MA]|uniref:Copper chaperone PCu(A)C n=1 Tax=Alishewanella maricola TaxID=2795740 RepID=A0ABS8BZE6_9ALTE|nr:MULTISPECIES: copper chaperone PCu(A)C [Alishewanella]MCB5225439.1 copper chaperone PCu(A)C [Alishewanella maricola]MDP4944612.1 copper chaperone PCu(A)C [Alishewanella sp.]MDP5188093.1 copper chaperone PCu(A)C [Alishewanella sp.]MDP5458671.1 copper chaperone PCu(A)C [Alishewanella sp. SMS8]
MRYFFFMCCSALCLASAALSAAELQLTQAEVRAPLPGRTVTAGYFQLQNDSTKSIELVSASSPAFEVIELHQHIEQDGMMRMVEVASIEVDAGARLIFAPGGLHMMMFTPTQPLVIGETVPVTLQFKDGSQLQFAFPLVAMPRR